MAKELIYLDNVSKSYEGHLVLDELNLTISENSFVTLLGPSGCGKTTTLRLLAGFETPDKGRILFDGKDITQLPPNRRQVNTVFQNYSLFSHMDVAENIAFGPKIHGKPRDYIRDKIRYALKLVNLDGYEHANIVDLSGGQQQRVAIARALALHPDILCFDEPTSALDPELTGEVLRVLRDLADRKTTMIIVTHEMHFARDVADRIMFMDGGVVVEEGPAKQLIEHPQEERTKQFLSHYGE